MTRALVRLPVAVLYGVPGVGKSALAYACGAAHSGPLFYARAEGGCSLASLVAELCRVLGSRAVQGSDEAHSASLVEALEARGAWLLLDDVDRLPAPSAETLLRSLGRRLRRGRALVTSRTRLAAPDHYDRLELLIGGLDVASARKLWRGLDQLRGHRAGFEEAYRASKGCPASLRRAHAGDPSASDPYAPIVRRLDPDAFVVATALALAAAPLGAEALLSLLPGERAEVARRELDTHLLIEVDGSGASSLYPPAREAVLATLGLDPASWAAPALVASLREGLPPCQAPSPAVAPAPVVVAPSLDAHCHELRAGGRVLCLAERPVLRGLLYALAARPNVVVSKEALVNAVWSVRYHPLRHDNALFVNIRRLREALVGTGLVVRNEGGGYALAAPASFVFRAAAGGG